MKRILIPLLMCFGISPAFAQDDPDYLSTPPPATPFASKTFDMPVIERGATRLSAGEVDALIFSRPGSTITLSTIDTYTRNLDTELEFRRVHIFAPGARIRVIGPDTETEMGWDTRQFYLATNASMGVGLAVDPVSGEITGFASKYGQPMKISGNFIGQLAFEPIEEVEEGSNFCGTDNKDQPYDMSEGISTPDILDIPGISAARAGETISYEAVVAIETDTEWLDGFGDDTGLAMTWITDIFLAMNVFYERDIETRLLIGDVILRTGTDPYTEPSNRKKQLTEFGKYWMDNMDGVDRQFAAMFSGRDIPPGWFSGIAWVNSYCNNGSPYGDDGASGSYSYNAIGAGRTPGNTAIYVGHELGHNLGSKHTHCYSPPIDNCYNGEDGCFDGDPVCPAGGKGTTMSYCHVVGDNGAGCGTSNQEFHPTVQTRLEGLLASQNAAGCIGTFSEEPAPEPEFDSTPVAGSVLDYGDQLVGVLSASTPIQVENLGDADLTVSCGLSGANPGSFELTACPSLVVPSAIVNVTVGCKPLATGNQNAVLTLTTNDADESSVTFDLLCKGVEPPDEGLIFSDNFEDP